MAAVEVTISGVLYDKHRRTMQNVVLIGEASLTGVGIGGGPMPPGQGPGGDHIWGPTDPRPTPPIYWPGFPGGGGGGRPPDQGAHPDHTLPGDLPHPEHPIVIPDPRPPELPPMDQIPVGATIVITKTAEGPKWAYIPPPPGGVGPPGNLPPFPHPEPIQQGQQAGAQQRPAQPAQQPTPPKR